MNSSQPVPLAELDEVVNRVVNETPVIDMHTHLYSQEFGDIGLWGIDELVNYHYLIAEVFRFSPISYASFWSMGKTAQADLIWKTLFHENSPISEATRGILTVLHGLGLDTRASNLNVFREYFRQYTRATYTDKVLKLAKVQSVVMTNDPFDENERTVWMASPERDPRFKAVLRLDPLLLKWKETYRDLLAWGYEVQRELDDGTLAAIRRFLEDWSKRMRPVYMAVSLPPDFHYPDDSPTGVLIERCILPVCREFGLPFSMMIGVRKLVNPDLKLAGDSLGIADVSVVERLCMRFPQNRFLVSMLARENQHALCVAARKFRNLLPFGCWWFMNNPSIIEEITRERFELLGTSFIPQHSDARVLDQLLYKWPHSRAIIAKVMVEKYSDLIRAGWSLTEETVRRDVEKLFQGNFASWIADSH